MWKILPVEGCLVTWRYSWENPGNFFIECMIISDLLKYLFSINQWEIASSEFPFENRLWRAKYYKNTCQSTAIDHAVPVKPRNFYVAVYWIYEGNVCKKELFYYKIFTVDALGTYFNEDQCFKHMGHGFRFLLPPFSKFS
jgi:hypothetical protein